MNNDYIPINYYRYKILCKPFVTNERIAIFYQINSKYAGNMKKTISRFASEKYGWEFTTHKVPIEFFIERFNLDRNYYKELAIELGEMDKNGNPLMEVEYDFE